MSCKVLVVEDEIFAAIEIEHIVAELGHTPVGIAADSETAMRLAPEAEIALVDLNLRDGATGPAIGRMLSEKHGVTVIFLTANPTQIAGGIPGTLGVLSKPACDSELRETLEFAVTHRFQPASCTHAPARLTLFANGNAQPADTWQQSRDTAFQPTI